jgi:acetyl-CoA C-acetyltransferase
VTGCSGAFLTTKAVYRLQRIGGHCTLVKMCNGGGPGIATVFGRL